MQLNQRVKLTRETPAVAIPFGHPVTLPPGSEVQITQALGGSYTVMTELGQLVRVESRDADALGIDPATVAAPASVAEGDLDPPKIEKLVWDLLRTCYDPEIPVNIVDLGLIYHCGVTPLSEGGHRVDVRMTLTAPGCGMGGILKMEIESRVLGIPTVKLVEVELVSEPAWNPGMMSEAARLELGFM